MKKSFKGLCSRANCLKYIPNALTLCNSLCGFAAILLIVRTYTLNAPAAMKYFEIASVIIFLAMIFDVCDGLAARLFNAASLHGIQMDSLSDMVTFGVIPATLVAVMSLCFWDWNLPFVKELYIYLLCCVYLSGASLRLATYNVHAMQEKKSSDHFSGLPSPGAAAAICVAVFYVRSRFNSNPIIQEKLGWILPAYAAVLGLLMTSTVPYIHAGKWLMSIRRNRRKLPLVVLMLAVILCFRSTGLAFLTLAYLLSGPIMLFFNKIFPREKKGEN